MIDPKWNWQKLMIAWNQKIFSSRYKEGLSDEQLAQRWLGHAGASEDTLKKLEQRLQMPLPPSYRNFLAFTNGWEGMLTPFINQLWSADEVDWFIKGHERWINAWRDDDTISETQYKTRRIRKTSYIKHSHLQSALAVSKKGDAAIMLLDPLIINKAGEWEAVFFANWIPGVQR